MPSRSKTFLVAGPILALVLGACNVSVSTAHIGSLQIGSSKEFTTETTSFGPQDTVYARATGNNLPNPVTMKANVIAEAVTGQASNAPIPQLDQSYDLASDGSVTLTYSPPTAGWPTGTYKIVVTMLDGATQRDQKSAEFKVSG